MKLNVIALIFFGFPVLAHSQSIERQVVASTGNFVQNTEGSLSFTIGEPTVVLGNSANSFVLQGFQQPHLIISTGIIIVNNQNPCQFALFPNPSHETLNYQSSTASATFEIYDLMGKNYGKFSATNGAIDVEMLSAGTYFLRMECAGMNGFSQKFVKQ